MSAEVSFVTFSENFQLYVQILVIVFFDLGPRNSPISVRIFAKTHIVRTNVLSTAEVILKIIFLNKLFFVEFEVRASVLETESRWNDS